jgi:hypothetical protein
MSKNILLVDKRVEAYETIVSAVNPELCVPIVFDYYTETVEDIKAKIQRQSVAGATHIGLVQHNYGLHQYRLFAGGAGSRVFNVAVQDPILETWTELRDFISWCKTTPEVNATYFDMMACALYSDTNWKYVIDTLTTQTGVTIRASTDDTGASSLGGDWFLESHTGVNLKDIYFTEAIEQYNGIFYSYPFKSRNYTTKSFVTGSVFLWGGGISSDLTYQVPSDADLSSGVIAVYSNENTFAALKTNGSVVTWGDPDAGGDTSIVSNDLTSEVVSIYSTFTAFAALKTNGTVVSWGFEILPPVDSLINVVEIYSNFYAFAALKSNGSVVTWGYESTLAGDSSSVSSSLESGVVAIYSNEYAFAALKRNGSVVVWGDSANGGLFDSDSIAYSLSSGVVVIYSTLNAFAALKDDGSVITWGNSSSGGDSSSVALNLISGVISIYSSRLAFAALKSDGSVVTWGDSNYGGDSSSVSSLSSEVLAVYSTEYNFAALKTNGSVVMWGHSSTNTNISSLYSNVVAVYSTVSAYAFLKTNGSVITYGNSLYGGNSSSVSSDLSSNVVAVYSTNSVYEGAAFTALKTDGSVVTWGQSEYGSDTRYVSSEQLVSGNFMIYSSTTAFVSLKSEATTFDISASYYTDLDKYNILRKKENRRRVDLTVQNNNVFTLSHSKDLTIINPNIPSSTFLRIIVPTYVSSPYTITSTATIPNSYGSFIVACDESEPVTISGTTYVNYGAFVYEVNANEDGTVYTKIMSTIINSQTYDLYGGDGINSSGIVFITGSSSPSPVASTFSAATFTVASSKTFGDASFAITTRPTSNSDGAVTYSSSNTSVATIDASGSWITLVGAGDVSFNATQDASAQYLSSTVTSNTLTVARGTSTLSSATFSVASSKTILDTSFTITTRPTSNSTGAITYSSSNPDVASIDACGNWISLVGAGDVSFNATQAATAQYLSATVTSNTLTVSKAMPTLEFVSPPTTKNVTDASFAVVASSASSGTVTYSSSNTSFATVGGSTGVVTLKGAGTVTITASQASTATYESPTNATCSIVIASARTALQGQTVSSSTSYASVDLSGASLVGTTISGVSFSGANLSNVDFSGAVTTNTNFTNANISGAINLPTFSTVQKLQLLKNINNVEIGAVQVNVPVTGNEINALLATPISEVATATFTIKAPLGLDENANKLVSISSSDISSGKSVYIPMNANENVNINNVVYSFDGTNILDITGNIVTKLTILGVEFNIYAGSIIAVNTTVPMSVNPVLTPCLSINNSSNRWFGNQSNIATSDSSDRIKRIRNRAVYQNVMNIASQGGIKRTNGNGIFTPATQLNGKCVSLPGETGSNGCVSFYIRSAPNYENLLHVTQGIYEGYSRLTGVASTPVPANADTLLSITENRYNYLNLNTPSGGATTDLLVLSEPMPTTVNNGNRSKDPGQCMEYPPNQNLSITYGGEGCSAPPPPG